MVNRYSPVLAALTSLVAAYGCGGSKAPGPQHTRPIAIARTTKATTKPSVAAVTAKPKDDATRDTIPAAHGIRNPYSGSDEDTHFAFDSAHMDDLDRRMLRTLANHFVLAPLTGRQMSLVGHADARGSAEDTRISTTSRNGMDTAAADETSTATGQRVEVPLGR